MGVPGELSGWRWLAGRAGRAEYWLWFVVLFGWSLLLSAAPANPVHLILPWLIFFQMIRRLHDVGLSGWWVLALPGAALIVLAISDPALGSAQAFAVATLAQGLGMMALGAVPGTRGANRFGARRSVRPSASRP